MKPPTQHCRTCKRVVIVRLDGRGFPPDTARRKLVKLCNESGCPCDPQYIAGLA